MSQRSTTGFCRFDGVRIRTLTRNRGTILMWLGAALWFGAVLAAMAWMTNYSFRPGPEIIAREDWPNESLIKQDVSQPTLLLFAHPRCPCTRATLEELARLTARCQGRFTTQVWFTKPVGVSDDWMQTDLWRTAEKIPGVSVHVDEAGREAVRFGAQTSGHAMLYDPAGHLLFQGGITISRGHAGDNPGRAALEQILADNIVSSGNSHTPVFGCLLANPAQCEEATCKR